MSLALVDLLGPLADTFGAGDGAGLLAPVERARARVPDRLAAVERARARVPDRLAPARFAAAHGSEHALAAQLADPEAP